MFAAKQSAQFRALCALACGLLLTLGASPASASGHGLHPRAAAGNQVLVKLSGVKPGTHVVYSLGGRVVARGIAGRPAAIKGVGFARNASWRTLRARVNRHRTVARARFAAARSRRTAPTIVMTGAPTGSTTATDATFTFSASASTTCSLDGGAYKTCASPAKLTGLAVGTHKFVVRAVNRYGTTTLTSSWTVVAPAPAATTAPVTTPPTTTPPVTTPPTTTPPATTTPADPSVTVTVADPAATPATPATPTTTTPPASSGASGEAMPVGDLPGWHQVFTDDFTRDVPLGSFPKAVSDKWDAYDGFNDTSKNGTYNSAKVISQKNGLMDLFIHTENGVHMVGAPAPKVNGSAWDGQLYGRYAVRFRADSMPGYHTAWLLWPDSESWPRDGEIDFPEGDLDDTMCAYMHRQGGTSGSDQDAFCSNTTYQGWHTAVLEWAPGQTRYIIDGKVIGTSTSRIPNTPMHWVLQTETAYSGTPSSTVSGHVQIDWVSVWQRSA